MRVEVEPIYVPEQSAPRREGEGVRITPPRYVFAYRVRIVNGSGRTVQLLSRRWLIVDADGESHVVEGEGVIGQQPVLAPGAEFVYASYCPLATEWGTMEGEYTFAASPGGGGTASGADAARLQVHVARFYLVADEDAE